jgi:2-keto-4-pentenoate hydratase/2-oxohepta-3-ene-1,7-dioic acid hydratase in catechol pathway
MRFVRYQASSGEIATGWVLDNQVGFVDGSIFGEFKRSEANQPIASLRMCPPVQPTKIICVGRNYVAHAEEHNVDVPEIPLIFLKPPSSLLGHNEHIILPPQSSQVEHEAELAVVIGKQGRWISHDEALNFIHGYTIANDVTARDLQHQDVQWTRGKGFDTFCPLGPWVETDFNPADAIITCNVNGEIRQMASTRDMVFNIQQLIAFISSIMTLEVGDLILTGTPSGVSPLQPEDEIEITIEGIGTLRNRVISQPSS